MKRVQASKVIFPGILMLILISACTANKPVVKPTTTATAAMETATATTPAPRVLTICIGQEPSSLYIYKGNSHSMWSVLEAVYDGPIDTVNYQPVPVILNEIPTTSNGSLAFQPIPVKAGDIVVDVNGNPVNLAAGVKVFPSGCTSGSCAITWDGTTALSMDRMVANFVIKPGVKWSDGQPLTAEDSVYSYTLAADPATTVTKKSIDQTDTYQAIDSQTVQWISKPGLVTTHVDYYFWIPLPKHAWQGLTAGELQTAVESNLKPLGWGPYMIDEWTPGDHIRLVKNPNYFRTNEGLPYFDTLIYRFVSGNADSNLQAIASGECDIADQSVAWEQQYNTVRDSENAKTIQVYRGLGPEWEHLDFGIKPVAYDDGYTQGVDRVDFFGDVRVRQAFANCINRADLVKNVMKNLSEVPLTYLPPNHPDYTKEVVTYSYDLEKGIGLLDQVGWKDLDNSSATPRTAQGITNVPDGTPFEITLTTSDAELRVQAVNEISSDLAKCGVKVTVNSVSRSDLYAAAPDGAVFGRKFDLAEFAWSAGTLPPCFIYTSGEIPTAANHWLGQFYGGLNNMGYSNLKLDEACKSALTAGLDQSLAASSQKEVQKILADDLPSIPLFYFVKLAVSRTDLCGLKMDASSRSEFYNLEAINYGAGCQK